MGILRTDRVSGLGGANAIKGSVFFDGTTNSSLRTEIDDIDDFVLELDDWTVEFWFFYQLFLDNKFTLMITAGWFV